SLADHHHLVRYAAAAQDVDRVGKDVEPLFHHEPAEKRDDGHLAGDPPRLAPHGVAAPGVEDVAFNPAGPDPDIIVHPLLAQHLREAFRRSDERVAATIEAPQPGDDQGFEEGEVIVAKIGLKARVDRTGNGDP